MTTQTNIKNLPVDNGEVYFTEIGYSQSYPWVEVSRTAKTVTLAKVNVAPDPEWEAKMEYYPGGFCGHMANQQAQTWLYAGVDREQTKTIRMTKQGWAYKGVRFVEGRAREFYDYNF